MEASRLGIHRVPPGQEKVDQGWALGQGLGFGISCADDLGDQGSVKSGGGQGRHAQVQGAFGRQSTRIDLEAGALGGGLRGCHCQRDQWLGSKSGEWTGFDDGTQLRLGSAWGKQGLCLGQLVGQGAETFEGAQIAFGGSHP